MPVTAPELKTALEAATGIRVRSIERRPSSYRTSYSLEEVDARLDDGSTLALVLKHTGDAALSAAARAAKPAFLADAAREIAVYSHVLPAIGPGAPRTYGSGANWLLLERVDAVELYQIGDLERWEAAGRWAARMHGRLAHARVDGLVVHDRDALGRWLDRAIAYGRLDPSAEAARRYDEVLALLLDRQPGFLHGELYASNVLVDATGARVCAVDWEMAGLGPQLLDLAALTVGNLSEPQRARIAAAYRREAGDRWPDRAHFERVLDACRLQISVQWLGWSQDWSPPAEHATDWHGELARAADRLWSGVLRVSDFDGC